VREQVDLLFTVEPTDKGSVQDEKDAAPGSQPPTPPSAKSDAGGMDHQPQWVIKANEFIDANIPRTPAMALLRDRATFCLGLANVMLSALLLLSHPRAFINYFIFKSFVLLGSRWFVYRLKLWHYYMLEFCYVAIGLGVVHTLLAPRSVLLFKTTFALYAGVLTAAVVATRNAFVLHSVDKITSLYQHLTPALVAWLLRWRTADVVPGWGRLSEEGRAAYTRAGFVDLCVAPMVVWGLWAATYYYLIFVRADAKVRERGYATMFKLQTRNPRAPISKFVFSFRTKEQQYAAYLAVHGGTCFAGCLLNLLWFHSIVLHTALILAVMASSMWAGATWYFREKKPGGSVSVGDAPRVAEQADHGKGQ